MKKPTSLDSVQLVSLNTRISCEGIEYAESGYRTWCAEAGIEVEEWAIRYLRLYKTYHKPSFHPYIDVNAAQRALDEA